MEMPERIGGFARAGVCFTLRGAFLIAGGAILLTPLRFTISQGTAELAAVSTAPWDLSSKGNEANMLWTARLTGYPILLLNQPRGTIYHGR